jgi:hypothetical protein
MSTECGGGGRLNPGGPPCKLGRRRRLELEAAKEFAGQLLKQNSKGSYLPYLYFFISHTL